MTDSAPTTLTLTQPDDWHLHLRDGEALAAVADHTAQQFARAIVMPNLNPPVTNARMAADYRKAIMAVLPDDSAFEPLMTLYLTDNTRAADIEQAHESGMVKAVKFYPAGATTNSDAGVTDLKKTYPALHAMAACGMPLLVHGEVTDPDVDVFDREAVFIETVLKPLMDDIPELRIVLEHITTGHAVKLINQSGERLAATITAHHLLMNRNSLFKGGIRPHHYCLPVLKRETHRLALLDAIRSGHPRYFLGTDSAPHARENKESACGCAGMYTAHAAIELYATAFEQAGVLDKLEAFASLNGPDFYRLPRNTEQITLRRQDWQVPDNYPMGISTLIPLYAGEHLHWKLGTD
ncbi:MAG TPA: dihydroorotase [Gammaproteobacteria bacterium]|nr:dihydroorotase [Gammaproteobacteria bacterium]